MRPMFRYSFLLKTKDGISKAVVVNGRNQKDAYENAVWMFRAEGTVLPPLPSKLK